MDAAISVDELTKYYGRTVGVERICFDVDRGEIFGFLGPNGAGKTTTIRLLLHLLHPTSGRISLLGRSVSTDSYAIRLRCGYLPGDFVGYGHVTTAAFLELAADFRSVKPQRKAALLDRFGITVAHMDQKMKHLSHGTRQKIGIVQAFLHDPELVILDEPTNGLDPLMQEEFYGLLEDYRQEGGTIFFSSHNLSETEKVCGRVAIIRKGRIVALETLDRLKKKRRRRLILTLAEPIDALELPGAEFVGRTGARYEFLVKGSLKDLLAELSQLPIVDLVFPEPDLEEVFMAYYEAEEDE